MKLTLYHYVHCPFCIRVRMGLGLLKLPYKSVVLPYADEKTPLALTGTKMLPIMEINGQVMNESLDILAALDRQDFLKLPPLLAQKEYSDLQVWLNKLGSNVHNLAMPYWIWTPEFDATSRTYFTNKKEKKRGPFNLLVGRFNEFNLEIQKDLLELENELEPFYRSDKFTVYDILLASHLWGLYVVPEFQFPVSIHKYLQEVKKICHFNYHQDFWS